jgi:hypothetical protein
MIEDNAPRLEELALDVARNVLGDDARAVKNVKVESAEDSSDKPIYVFTFLIDQHLVKQRAGLLRIRIGQQLRDALIAQNDAHYPMLRILDQTDWDRHASA